MGKPSGVLWKRQKLQTRGTQYVLALAEKEAVFFQLNHVNVSGDGGKRSSLFRQLKKNPSGDRTNHVQAGGEKQVERRPWQKAEFK